MSRIRIVKINQNNECISATMERVLFPGPRIGAWPWALSCADLGCVTMRSRTAPQSRGPDKHITPLYCISNSFTVILHLKYLFEESLLWRILQQRENMTSATQRLAAFAAQLIPSAGTEYKHQHHIHQLSPTFFLPRAAAIEPDVSNFPED